MGNRPTWDRFDKNFDYRTLPTTKPHDSHINHLFLANNGIWVTRGYLHDAVNLNDVTQKMNSEQGLCHDGFVVGNHCYFTTVNGHILIKDIRNFETIKDININEMLGPEKTTGWVRGIAVHGNMAFVGNSGIRPSKFKEYTKWALKRPQNTRLNAGILQIDLEKNKIIEFFPIKHFVGGALFTLIAR